MIELPRPDVLIELPDGRRMGLDDRGDPGGIPVLYLHGTPDSRLARHPDDAIAASAGIRFLAVDRPGIGGSDADPLATPRSVADDLVGVLDALGLGSVGVLSWSAGSIHALALAGHHPERVRRLVLATPLVPADAYDDPGVLDGADDARRLFAEAHRELSADEVGSELAMWLVPPVLDDDTARTLLTTSLAAVAHIPGAEEQLLGALAAAVGAGMTGIEREITAQATPLAGLLDEIRCPVGVHVGADDTVAPPAMGSWIARRLGAGVRIHRGVGHTLPLHHWAELLRDAAGAPQDPGDSAPSQGITGTSDHNRSSS